METKNGLKIAVSFLALSIVSLESNAATGSATDKEKALAVSLKKAESSKKLTDGKKAAVITGLAAVGGGAAGYKLATNVLGNNIVGKLVGLGTGLAGGVGGAVVGAGGSLLWYGPKSAISGLGHGFQKLGCKTGCAAKDVDEQVSSYDSKDPNTAFVGKLSHCLTDCQLTDTTNYTCAVLQHKFSDPEKVIEIAKLLNEGPTNSKRASTKLEKIFIDEGFANTCQRSISDPDKLKNFKENFAALSFAGRIFMYIRLNTMAESKGKVDENLKALAAPGIVEQGIKEILAAETEGASDIVAH